MQHDTNISGSLFDCAGQSIGGATPQDCGGVARKKVSRRKVEAKIIWQSKRFAWMTFSDLQLSVFRERYPRIQRWLPFLEELETWVATNAISNPARIPSPQGWGNFLNNCARGRHKDILSGYRRPDGQKSGERTLTNAEYYGGGQRSEVGGQSRDAMIETAAQLRKKLATLRPGSAEFVKTKHELEHLRPEELSLKDVFQKLSTHLGEEENGNATIRPAGTNRTEAAHH